MGREENFKGKTKETQFKAGQEQVKIAQKGGIASGKAKRKKIIFKEIFEHISNVKLSNEKHIQKLKELYPEVTEDEMNYGVLSAFRILEKSLSGSTKAFEIVRDTMGQAPVQKQEITNIDQDGYRRVLMGDEDIFAGDYGSADESDEEEKDKKE